MDSKTKKIFMFITYGVILFAASMNIPKIMQFLGTSLGMAMPIIMGLIFAFVLNVPMKGFENMLTKLFDKTKVSPKNRHIRTISLFLTMVSIVLVVALAFTIVIPQVAASIKSIYPLIQEQWPVWMEYLEMLEIDISQAQEWLANLDIRKITNSAGAVLGSVMNIATSTLSGATNVMFALIIAFYALLSKKSLGIQTKKLLYANLSHKYADRICSIAALVQETYSKFLSSQCIEAMLLGFMVFVAFTLFGLPYGSLVGFVTALTAFIPYVGAVAGCFIGAFLTLLASPGQVILSIVVYTVTQFIENQFIYPYVVGNSVGLSPLWTMVAALVGGKLFGLVGIIFFIPLVAVIYTLVKENTDKKLIKKGEIELQAVEEGLIE